MKLHGLVKVKTNSGTTGHAITTPSVKPFEEIRAEADVSWISELQWPAPYYPASVAVLATMSSLIPVHGDIKPSQAKLIMPIFLDLGEATRC